MTASYRAQGAPIPTLVSNDDEWRAPSGPTGKPARVLIVDDIPENRSLLVWMCEQLGFATQCAEGGRQAVEAARTSRFDLILMDIFMPHVDGMEATRQIRALREPIASIPILAIATDSEPGHVVRYRACGMTDVVAKPISRTRLAEAAAAALASRPSVTRRRRREAQAA